MSGRLSAWLGSRESATQQGLRVIGASYLLIGVFGVAYIAGMFSWARNDPQLSVAVAALVAAPIGLGLLWPRLSGFKAFGVEVSLVQVTVQTEPELVAAITATQYFSGGESLIGQLSALVAQAGTELLEVNLRDGDYWWSTRLYLLAALADDHSNISSLIFVEGTFDRTFLGMADPHCVRRAIAIAQPLVEQAYNTIRAGFLAPMTPADEVRSIISLWPSTQFLGSNGILTEDKVEKRINKDRLQRWLARSNCTFNRDSLEWTGMRDRQLVRALITDFDGAYVALLRSGCLDRVVNRWRLSARQAERSI